MTEFKEKFQENGVSKDPLTYQETIEFLQKHKLDEYADDLANEMMIREKEGSRLFYCFTIGCLKWIRQKTIDGKIQVFKNSQKKKS